MSAMLVELDVDEARGAGRARARGDELHQQLLARNLHGGDLPMPLPQPLQLPPAHGTFLGHPIETLGKDMEFAGLGRQFDLNALAGLLTRLIQQVLLQTVQASLGRADGIVQFCRR